MVSSPWLGVYRKTSESVTHAKMEFLHTKKNEKTNGSAFKISEMYCVDTDNWVLVSNTEAKMVTCQDANI